MTGQAAPAAVFGSAAVLPVTGATAAAAAAVALRHGSRKRSRSRWVSAPKPPPSLSDVTDSVSLR
jgi:hypothetical protein